ncbi:MAG: hypothetical protein PHP23_14440 [Desulfobacterales bacterium]|nr:hypothetical protein [Desulfobacterales bacterium]MDD4072255.1 hypothetical protein [Desulfobacterales bacterium]MDD4392793.1 hypothetical protein [Desulfobacterales bacterium]
MQVSRQKKRTDYRLSVSRLTNPAEPADRPGEPDRPEERLCERDQPDPPLAYDSEESETGDDPLPAVDARAEEAGEPDKPTQSESRPPVQSAEKVEEVFNTGMQFIAGLFEMATGQKVIPAGDQKKMIHIDRATGEVTMKFKLPGHHS